MFKHISTKELVFITMMGVAWFILDFLVGQWVNALTGLFLIGAAVSSVVAGFFVVIMAKIRPKFGTFTLALLIFGLLALPTASAGPVGFWPKVVANFLAGFVGDSWFKFTKYKTWGIVVGFYVVATALLYLQTFSLIWFGIPEAGEILRIMPLVVLGFWVIGTLGLWLGFFVYRRIKDKHLVRQLQN